MPTITDTITSLGDTVVLETTNLPNVIVKVSGDYNGIVLAFDMSDDEASWNGALGNTPGLGFPLSQYTLPDDETRFFSFPGTACAAFFRVRAIGFSAGEVTVTITSFDPNAGWTPASIPDAVSLFDSVSSPLWQLTNGTMPVSANNDRVARWDDLVSGYNLLSANDVHNRGYYKTGIFNGNPGIYFSGNPESLASAPFTWPNDGDGTMFAVFKQFAVDANLGPFLARDIMGPTVDTVRYQAFPDCYPRNLRADRLEAFAPMSNDTDVHTFCWRSGADYKVFLDGVQIGTTQAINKEAPDTWVTGRVWDVYSNMYVAMMVAYSRAIDADELARLQEYAQERFGAI